MGAMSSPPRMLRAIVAVLALAAFVVGSNTCLLGAWTGASACMASVTMPSAGAHACCQHAHKGAAKPAASPISTPSCCIAPGPVPAPQASLAAPSHSAGPLAIAPAPTCCNRPSAAASRRHAAHHDPPGLDPIIGSLFARAPPLL